MRHTLITLMLLPSVLVGQDSLYVSRLWQQSGFEYTRDVAIQGNLAYVAADLAGLLIFDISDPANPMEVGSYVDPFGSVISVTIEGHYAYLGIWGPGFTVLDISASPFVILPYQSLLGAPWGIAVHDNFIYIADEDGGLRIWDIACPCEVGYNVMYGGSRDVAVDGNFAYVADGSSSVRVIDVSDPTSPEEIGYLPGWAIGIDLVGDYAYVAGDGLRIIDVSNPTLPSEIAFVNLGPCYDVVVRDRYAFVASWSDGLRIIDVSTPRSPIEVGYYNTPGFPQGLAIDGCTAFVADYDYFGVYDISHFIPCDPNRPSAPDSLVVQYIPASNLARLTWTRVTRNLGGNPIDISRYVILHAWESDAVIWDSIGTPVPPDTTVFLDSIYVNDVWGFYRVNAVLDAR